MIKGTLSLIYFYCFLQQDGIFKMCLSPKGTVLATIHQSGLLGLWDVPSMKRKKAWPKHEQVLWNLENRRNSSGCFKKKVFAGFSNRQKIVRIY